MSAIKSYLETLKTLNTQIESVNSQIADTNNEDVRLLMSVPGIDYYSAVLIHSEIGDISRFPSHNKLASWVVWYLQCINLEHPSIMAR